MPAIAASGPAIGKMASYAGEAAAGDLWSSRFIASDRFFELLQPSNALALDRSVAIVPSARREISWYASC